MLMAMTEDAPSAALDRLQRALDRLEAAAMAASSPSGRDEDLRSEVRMVIAELDRMIGNGRG